MVMTSHEYYHADLFPIFQFSHLNFKPSYRKLENSGTLRITQNIVSVITNRLHNDVFKYSDYKISWWIYWNRTISAQKILVRNATLMHEIDIYWTRQACILAIKTHNRLCLNLDWSQCGLTHILVKPAMVSGGPTCFVTYIVTNVRYNKLTITFINEIRRCFGKYSAFLQEFSCGRVWDLADPFPIEVEWRIYAPVF